METDRWEERRQRWEQKMESKRARWEDRAARRGYRSASQGIFFGAIVVAAGCLLLLDNLGIVRFHDIWQYWPVLLVAWGASRALNSRSPAGWVWGGMVALVGAFLLLDALHVFFFDIGMYWPVFVIAFGVSVLIKGFERNRFRDSGPAPQQPASPLVGAHAIFGENRSSSDAQDFQGGEASAIFGAARFDLRNASMTAGEARIHVDVVFGEAEVRIPETWNAVCQAAVICGGVNDKTIHPRPDPNVKTPRLVITGSVAFGAVTLRN
jgi:predicted membrane protein